MNFSHQIFHKIVYFQLILCAFLFHLNEDTVLCSTLYHESPQGLQSNASMKHLSEKANDAIIDSTGKKIAKFTVPIHNLHFYTSFNISLILH